MRVPIRVHIYRYTTHYIFENKNNKMNPGFSPNNVTTPANTTTASSTPNALTSSSPPVPVKMQGHAAILPKINVQQLPGQPSPPPMQAVNGVKGKFSVKPVSGMKHDADSDGQAPQKRIACIECRQQKVCVERPKNFFFLLLNACFVALKAYANPPSRSAAMRMKSSRTRAHGAPKRISLACCNPTLSVHTSGDDLLKLKRRCNALKVRLNFKRMKNAGSCPDRF